MTTSIELLCFTVDSANPKALAEFYRALLDWRLYHEQDAYSIIGNGSAVLGFTRVDGHVAAPWPDDPAHSKGAHIDLKVADTAQAIARAVELGATVPDFQPGHAPDRVSPNQWTVLLDPEGHPFCLVELPESIG